MSRLVELFRGEMMIVWIIVIVIGGVEKRLEFVYILKVELI